MNEKRIREVIEIERQAQELLDAANREAEQLPLKADVEARDLIERSRAEARAEAQHILAEAEVGEGASAIHSTVKSKMAERERLAAKNMERAVTFILDRVLDVA